MGAVLNVTEANMTILRVPSPAKLNLFLHIVGRRDNGYHELQSIFQLIDLYDWISFEAIEENQKIGRAHV